MKPYLEIIDTQTSGNRNDVTPLFADAASFGQLVDDLAQPFLKMDLDYVGCIDALGFILGTAVAQRLGVGIVPFRKGGKLPVETQSIEFTDYSHTVKRLEIRKDILPASARVLIVDEWIETGAQVEAAIALIEGQRAVVIAIATIHMEENERTDDIRKRYHVHTVSD